MVGDRQATAGYIASRDVRKIEEADHFTAIAISGTAARGIEFIRIAQLSFEHYEKMTDTALSLEGKANYLSPIIQRNNLSSPLIVMPLLAGWDVEPPGRPGLRVRRRRRLLRAHSTSRRSARARPSPRTPCVWASAPTSTSRPRSTCGALALYEAGDNDPATGGPDFVRNLFPMMVTRRTPRDSAKLAADDVAAALPRDQRAPNASPAGVAGGTLR